MKMDGDADHGWMGEVHDGSTLTAHSPQGGNVFEALMNMMHMHFGEPAAPVQAPEPPDPADAAYEPPPTAEEVAAADADTPEFHKMPAADLKDLMAEHDEPYVNKPQAVEFLQAKADEANTSGGDGS